MSSLQNQVAVITGGAQSIGFGICEALGAAGCEVIIADIRKERMQEASEKLVARGYRCDTIEVDVTNEDSVRSMVQQVKTKHARIDIFVNCAGAPPNVVPLIHLTTAEWTRVLNVNLLGVFLCCREVGALMVQQEFGKIINIASVCSFQGGLTIPAYTAAKHGVAGLTKALANEWASKNIHVNAIAPGYFDTEMCAAIVNDPVREPQIRGRIPAGRWGQPSDLVGPLLFLASDASNYVDGHVLVVDGGWMGR